MTKINELFRHFVSSSVKRTKTDNNKKKKKKEAEKRTDVKEATKLNLRNFKDSLNSFDPA